MPGPHNPKGKSNRSEGGNNRRAFVVLKRGGRKMSPIAQEAQKSRLLLLILLGIALVLSLAGSSHAQTFAELLA
jgi:hypothetical protein